jgi:hypothetical protein
MENIFKQKIDLLKEYSKTSPYISEYIDSVVEKYGEQKAAMMLSSSNPFKYVYRIAHPNLTLPAGGLIQQYVCNTTTGSYTQRKSTLNLTTTPFCFAVRVENYSFAATVNGWFWLGVSGVTTGDSANNASITSLTSTDTPNLFISNVGTIVSGGATIPNVGLTSYYNQSTSSNTGTPFTLILLWDGTKLYGGNTINNLGYIMDFAGYTKTYLSLIHYTHTTSNTSNFQVALVPVQ